MGRDQIFTGDEFAVTLERLPTGEDWQGWIRRRRSSRVEVELASNLVSGLASGLASISGAQDRAAGALEELAPSDAVKIVSPEVILLGMVIARAGNHLSVLIEHQVDVQRLTRYGC
jgi:hypothetical protein